MSYEYVHRIAAAHATEHTPEAKAAIAEARKLMRAGKITNLELIMNTPAMGRAPIKLRNIIADRK